MKNHFINGDTGQPNWKTIFEAVFVIVITILAIWSRFLNIGNAYMGMDEGATYYFSGMSFIDIVNWGEPNSPTYYLLEGWIVNTFGNTNFAFKFLSAFFGALCIPLTYFVGKKLTKSMTVGIVASIFMILCPILLHYDQEARGFAVAAFFFLLSFYIFLMIMDDMENQALWIAFAIVSIIGINMHFVNLMPTAIMVIYIIYINYKERYPFASVVKKELIAAAVFVILILPLVPSIFSTLCTAMSYSDQWESGLGFIKSVLFEFCFKNYTLMYVITALFIIGSYFIIKEKGRIGILTISVFVIPFLFLIIVSLFSHATNRYLIYAAPIFFIGAAYLLVHIKENMELKAVVAIISVAIVVSVSVPALESYYDNNARCSWDKVTDVLNKEADGDDCIIYSPEWIEWGLIGGLSFYYDYDAKGVDVLCADNMDQLNSILNDGKYDKIYVLTWDADNPVVNWAKGQTDTTLRVYTNGLSLFQVN